MTKEKVIDLEGTVLSLKPGRNLKLKIKDKKNKTHLVDLPIRINNSLEVMPYQFFLNNQEVKYKKVEITEYNCGLTDYTRKETKLTLTVKSGPLKGNTYKLKYF